VAYWRIRSNQFNYIEEAGRAACQGGGEDVERHCKVMPPKICVGRRVPLALRPPSALGASCLDLNCASPHLQYPTSKELSIGRVRFKAFGLDGHQINHSRLGPLRQGQLQCQMFCKPVLPSTASFFDPKEIYLAMGKTGSHHFHLTSLTFFYLWLFGVSLYWCNNFLQVQSNSGFEVVFLNLCSSAFHEAVCHRKPPKGLARFLS